MSTTIRLGLHDGNALVALTGDLASTNLPSGSLPATAECRVANARGLLYRVPPGSVRGPSEVQIVYKDGIFVHDDGEVGFDGGEIAELPVRWLAWLETASADLDYRSVRRAKRGNDGGAN